jgi:hypothetical protein
VPSGRDGDGLKTEKETDMTEPRKPLSFAEILDLADGTAPKIRKLARLLETDNPFAACGDREDEIAAGLAQSVAAIREVMKILQETSNTDINREGLDALQEQFNPALEMLAAEWAVDLLNKPGEYLIDDEIAF